MSIKFAPAGTPLESAEKFKEIGDAFASIAPTLTAAFDELGKAAVRTAASFQGAFNVTMTRRELRRFQAAMARLDRRPPLLHKGGKP